MFGKRLKELRQKKGLTLQQVGDVFGITRASVAGWERDESRPDQDKLPALARLFDTTLEYLLTGSITYVRKVYDDNKLNEPQPPYSASNTVPIILWDQIGKELPENHSDFIVCPRDISGSAFALKVSGVSMEPLFVDGDVIFIDPEAPVANKKYVIYSLSDESQPVFRQLIIEGGDRLLRSSNPDWPGQKLLKTGKNDAMIGVVVGVWRDQ